MTHEEKLQLLETIFDTSNINYSKMMDIINTSDMSKYPLHKHHIIPKSYFKKVGIPVDNSNENLAGLTPYEHFYVHYYAWLCSKPIMKRSMASAFHLMIKTFRPSSFTLDQLAQAYHNDLSYNEEDLKNALKKINSPFDLIEFHPGRQASIFKCRYCGKTVKDVFKTAKLVTCSKCEKKRLNSDYTKRYLVVEITDKNENTYNISILRSFNGLEPSEYTPADLADKIVKRRVNDTLGVISYKIIGESDTELETKYKKPCKYTKDQLLGEVYTYSLSSKYSKELYPELSDQNARRMLNQYYNIDVSNIKKICCDNKDVLYYIDEFDNTHTMKDWCKELNLSWASIRNKYNPKVCKVKDTIDYLYEYYKKDPEILDRLKDILDRMKVLDKRKPCPSKSNKNTPEKK